VQTNQIENKSQKIQGMFNAISHRYDLLNGLLSFGRDKSWRKRGVRMLELQPGSHLLDLACGTGDVALTAARIYPGLSQITGMDFSENMLTLARAKFADKQIAVTHEFRFGDATELPLDDSSVDAVTIAFGIRNVVDVPKALSEIHRVLTPSGKLMILEFAPPSGKVFGKLFHFYFNSILPRIGGWISGQPEAYKYLPKSVGEFYSVEKLSQLITDAQLNVTQVKKLTFGVCVAYLAQKNI
jgi:demethylmenaquinone methyltransferase/2-methoxy-6-polyprenyl-1,4-benzoquinol methylase